MPRPSSPPGAKASTECPSLAQSTQSNPPCTGTTSPADKHGQARSTSFRAQRTIPSPNPYTDTLIIKRPEPCNSPRSDDTDPINRGRADTGSDKPRGCRHGHPTIPREQPERPPAKDTETSCAPRSAPEPDSPVKRPTPTPGNSPSTPRPTAVTPHRDHRSGIPSTTTTQTSRKPQPAKPPPENTSLRNRANPEKQWR